VLQRFAAASAVASLAIAVGVALVALTPFFKLQDIYPLPILWCFVPAVWGIWALIAPAAWVPERLALWGAVLGLIAASLAAFVLNLPFRVLGVVISLPGRGVAVVVMTVLYYLLWLLVRRVYRHLVPSGLH